MNAAFMRRLLTVLSITVVVLSLCSTAAMADELYARVRGVVTDTSGAVVTGVTLKITNVNTGISKQTTSSADGSYDFVNLIPGTYNMTATKAGFATFNVGNVKILANQIYVSPITMKVGAVTEEVTVLANPAQVEQTSMQLTATISDKTITDLPLNGRNWITLQQSLPGVVIAESRFTTNYSTNGSQAQQNSYLINGTDYNDLPLNSPLASPSPDAIAEVRMITNTINPEYGRNSGAIMNAISKSGTNQFHGSAFEFYRDTFLNTKTFFQNTPSIFHQNQYGGTVGGPILKNKTFVFFSLQNTRARQAQAFTTPTVFSNAERGGDFSAVLANISATKTNPFPIMGSNGTVYPAGTAWKTIFPTGIVPVGDFNAVSKTLLGTMVPVANLGQKFTFNPTTNVASNQYIGRFDQNFGQNNSLWFYALAQNATNSSTLPFTGANVPIPGVGDQSTTFTKQFTTSWSHTFSTSLLNELRVGYTRLNFNATNPQKPAPPSSFGFPDINSQLTLGQSMPFIGITGYFNLGFSTNGPQPRKDQTYQITDNLSWVHGRHSFKFGYEGRKFEVWNPFAARNNGSFSFSKTGFYSTGDPGLDFLLGVPSSYNQGSGGLIIADAYEHYFYAQDQWRLRNNLTLTYGLGYQIDTPLAEHQFNGVSRVCFIPGQQSKIYLTAPAGLNYPGDPGCNASGGATTKLGHFGPRVGFAYSPNWGWLSGGPGKLSIRGGFGVYYNRSEEELSLQDLQAPPTGLSSTGIADISTSGLRLVSGFPNPWVDVAGHVVAGFGNKFPFVPPAAGSSPDFSKFLPLSVNTLDPAATVPYAMNWNLTIERELPSQTILRIGYVGSHGANLVTAYDRNPVTPAGVAACLATPACLADPYSQDVNYPTHQQYPGNIFGGIGWERNRGWSNYDALQITVDKHTTHGLQLLGTYTWSHSLDVGVELRRHGVRRSRQL